jgi:hypothetical protein
VVRTGLGDRERFVEDAPEDYHRSYSLTHNDGEGAKATPAVGILQIGPATDHETQRKPTVKDLRLTGAVERRCSDARILVDQNQNLADWLCECRISLPLVFPKTPFTRRSL